MKITCELTVIDLVTFLKVFLLGICIGANKLFIQVAHL